MGHGRRDIVARMKLDPLISVDQRVRVASGRTMPGAVRLPELPGVAPTDDPLLDRIGRVVAAVRMRVPPAWSPCCRRLRCRSSPSTCG